VGPDRYIVVLTVAPSGVDVRTLLGPAARAPELLSIVGAAALGVALPAGGPALAPLTTPIVAFLVFASLKGSGGTGVRGSLRLVAGCLCVSYLALPAVAALVAAPLSPAASTGVLVAAAAPTTAGSAVVWTRLSGGDAALAAAVAVASILLSPVATPAVLSRLSAAAVALDATAVVGELLVVVGAAVLLSRATAGRSVDERLLDRGAVAAITLLVYVSVASSDPGGVDAPSLVGVAAAALAVLGAAAAVALAARRAFDLPDRIVSAVLFASGLKNLGIALAVAGSVDAAGVSVAVTAFYVVQQVASGVLAAAVRG